MTFRADCAKVSSALRFRGWVAHRRQIRKGLNEQHDAITHCVSGWLFQAARLGKNCGRGTVMQL